MKQYQFNIYLLVSLLFISSCSFEEKSFELKDDIREYVFFSHTYQSNTRVDNRIEALDLSTYEQIWLGGDVCSETTSDSNTIKHIDSIFDLRSSKTHWSIGNHDIRNGNLHWITDATGRPTFYTTFFNGITLLILNTNFSSIGGYEKTEINSQFELIQNVCDTIVKSSHLILITHHSVWNEVDKVNNMKDFANTDLSNLLFNIDPDLNYKNGVYPQLIKVAQRGVKVIHIAGDFGQKVTSYQYLTADNLQFIGSGITSNNKYHSKFPTSGSPDLFLVLHHNLSEQIITWSFEELL